MKWEKLISLVGGDFKNCISSLWFLPSYSILLSNATHEIPKAHTAGRQKEDVDKKDVDVL